MTIENTTSAAEFIDEKLRLYSAHSNTRGIPFIGDGFKQSHRKAVWGMMKRGENADKDTVERISAAGASCFTADTLVLMADGSHRSIGDITRDFNNGNVVEVMSCQESDFVKVQISNAMLTKKVAQLVEVNIDGRVIRCTVDHLFLTERGWVEAIDIDKSDILISQLGNKTGATVSVVDLEYEVPVFDLTVPNTHNFCVGHDNVVVHNCTDYAHGVGSFEGTVVGLAQDFAGSNNIPIFEKYGQFGDRLNKKPSASRYIKTKLGSAFRQIFRKEDDLIFEQIESNGMKVEPKYFMPILPLILVNGAEGMGTGHSTRIFCYNPEEIKSNILKVIDGKTLKKNAMLPWWRGFDGTVSRDPETGQVVIEGKYTIKEGRSATITVTELPIGIQSDQYKTHLDKLEDREIILDFDNFSDKRGFEFVIRIPKTTVQKSPDEIKKLFKLISRETENMTVWDADGVLRRYECAEDLLVDFVAWRLDRYEDRRQALIRKLMADIEWASMKIKFIKYYLSHYKYFRDTPNKELATTLVGEGFSRHDELLAMPMRNLTHDKIKELEKDVDDLKMTLSKLQKDSAPEMYKRELKELKL